MKNIFKRVTILNATFLLKVYIFINIFKQSSNTPYHSFSKRFYYETGVSHISQKDFCNKELLINADNWYNGKEENLMS